MKFLCNLLFLTFLCKCVIIISDVTSYNSVASVGNCRHFYLGAIDPKEEAMLDIRTATVIRKAINEHFSKPDVISLNAVCRMQPVVQNTDGAGYTVLALQYGDLTILVQVDFDEDRGVIVGGVKTQSW